MTSPENPLNRPIPLLQNLASVLVILSILAALFWFLLNTAIDRKITPEFNAIHVELSAIDRRLSTIERNVEVQN